MSNTEFNGKLTLVKKHYYKIEREDGVEVIEDRRGKDPQFMTIESAIEFLDNLLKEKEKLGIRFKVTEKIEKTKKGGINPVKTMIIVDYFADGRFEERRLREVLVEFKKGNFYFSKFFKEKTVEKIKKSTPVEIKKIVVPQKTEEVVVQPMNSQPQLKKGQFISIVISKSIYGYVSMTKTFMPEMSTIVIDTLGNDIFSILDLTIKNRNAEIELLSTKKLKAFNVKEKTHLASVLKALQEAGKCIISEEDFVYLNKDIGEEKYFNRKQTFLKEMSALTEKMSSW